jgi:hypothetical protein
MGRSVEDLIAASRVLFGLGTDEEVAPVPYRDIKLPARLKFGYYTDGQYDFSLFMVTTLTRNCRQLRESISRQCQSGFRNCRCTS